MADVQPSADFSAIAARYDETRDVPEYALIEVYRLLAKIGRLEPGIQILDIGCGTGQISLPLVRQGCCVTGVDISPAMIEIARAKSQGFPHAVFLVADAQALPFAHGSFDLATVSKLFMHVGNWQGAIDELLRVTKPDGMIVHLAERGAFKYALRRRLNVLADNAGYHDRFLGAQTGDEVRAYFQAKGCTCSLLALPETRWEKRITYAQQLDELNERLFAEYWGIPMTAYAAMMAHVAEWARMQPAGLATVEELHPYLTAEIYTIPNGMRGSQSTQGSAGRMDGAPK
jgi:SAM-dependent methyltransferase